MKLKINYGVKKPIVRRGKVTRTLRRGELEVDGRWSDAATHAAINREIRARHPEPWDLVAYAPEGRAG